MTAETALVELSERLLAFFTEEDSGLECASEREALRGYCRALLASKQFADACADRAPGDRATLVQRDALYRLHVVPAIEGQR